MNWLGIILELFECFPLTSKCLKCISVSVSQLGADITELHLIFWTVLFSSLTCFIGKGYEQGWMTALVRFSLAWNNIELLVNCVVLWLLIIDVGYNLFISIILPPFSMYFFMEYGDDASSLLFTILNRLNIRIKMNWNCQSVIGCIFSELGVLIKTGLHRFYEQLLWTKIMNILL